MGLLPQSKIERLVLPSTKNKPEAEQEWVDFETNPGGGDLLEVGLDIASDNLTTSGQILKAVTALVKKWSYVDADGAELPIIEQYVARLTTDDLAFLSGKAITVIAPQEDEELTKKSLPPSTPTAPAAG